jgi:hypothetical protein
LLKLLTYVQILDTWTHHQNLSGYLLMNYGFREAYFEYFESCNSFREITNNDVFVFMVDLRMINMSPEFTNAVPV